MKNKMIKVLKKVINFIKKYKVAFIIFIGVIILIIAIFSIINIIKVNNSQEKILTTRLEELGRSFYEDYYYDAIMNSNATDDNADAGKDTLASFKDLGLKISLDNLARFNTEETDAIYAEFVNEETNEECNKNSTMVYIYPKDPYGKEDYSINVKLVCGFNDDETTTTTTTTTEEVVSKE